MERPFQQLLVRSVAGGQHAVHQRLVRNPQEVDAAFVETAAEIFHKIGRQFARVVQADFVDHATEVNHAADGFGGAAESGDGVLMRPA